MSEIAFGTPEHIAGLSREALEADFRYVQDRRTELEEACERLQDENERLRSCLSDSAENERIIGHEFRELRAENEKLRELVRDMAVVICVYDLCVTVDDCPPALPMFADKMRELGVEV